MNKQIAVIEDQDGLSGSIFGQCVVNVYEKENEEWSAAREIPFSIERGGGLNAVRESTGELVKALDSCKIIAGSCITGIPYNILRSTGFCIIEAQGEPAGFLDEIQETLEKGAAQEEDQDEGSEAVCPRQTETEGNYSINLKEIQMKYPSLSSKKILLPFLQDEVFNELEVICSHIPPWFDVQLDMLGQGYSAENIKTNEYRVTIFHKTCSSSN